MFEPTRIEKIILWTLLVASISLVGAGSACIYKSEKTNYDCSIVLGIGLSLIMSFILFYLFSLFTNYLDKKKVVIISPISVV